MKGCWCVVCGCLAVAGPSPAGGVFDVRDYGARGDGVAKDTAAIQKAIDAATAAGGGTVELTAGTYLSGTIWLKDNVDFHLGAGATLLGSTEPADYNAADAFPQNRTSQFECNSGGHLVLCVEQRNVTVRGPGRIDGNGPKITLDKDGKRFPGNDVTYTGLTWRPGQMLFFAECENVRIQDVALENSPYWTCYVYGCERVAIRGVHIRNHPLVWNGDGIDLDASRYVTIADCRIESADDAITLRACSKGLRRPRDMAYVTVQNCFIRTFECNAIRIGVGDHDIHDAAFSNIVVEDSRTAVMIGNGYAHMKHPGEVRGTGVRNIRFDNMWSHTREFCLILAQFSGGATTENVAFSDIGGTADRKSRLWGNAKFPFRNITFRNVDFDHGVEAVNVSGLSVSGGSLKELDMDPDARRKLSDDITNYRNMTW